MRCLVVEDEGLIALDIAERLDEWDAESAIAPTLKAAMRMLEDLQPELVLLDFNCPTATVSSSRR